MNTASGDLKTRSATLSNRNTRLLDDDIVQLRTKWRGSLEHLSLLRARHAESRQELLSAFNSSVGSAPSPEKTKQVQDLFQLVSDREREVAAAEAKSRDLEIQISRIDYAPITSPEESTAVPATNHPVARNVIAGRRSSPPGEALPAELEEYFNVLGDLNIIDEQLGETLPADHADRITERERLRDQELDLSDSDEAFDASLREELHSIRTQRERLAMRAEKLRAICLKAGHNVDPSTYSKSSKSSKAKTHSGNSDARVRRWLDDARSTNVSAPSVQSTPATISSSLEHTVPAHYNVQRNASWSRGRHDGHSAQHASRVQLTVTPTPPQGIAFQQPARVLFGGPGEQELLDPTYKKRKDPRKFFITGKVFFTLWTEPTTSSSSTAVSVVRYGETVYSQIRRFVVIREGSNYCTALPISTYGGNGVAKSGLTKSEHAIIYTGKAAPQPLPHEAPGRSEDGMQPIPIIVDPASPIEKLDPKSRVNFGKTYTIEWNLKVKPFGMVRDIEALRQQYRNVLTASGAPEMASSSRQQPNKPSSPIEMPPQRETRAAPAAQPIRASHAQVNEESSSEDDDDDHESSSEEDANPRRVEGRTRSGQREPSGLERNLASSRLYTTQQIQAIRVPARSQSTDGVKKENKKPADTAWPSDEEVYVLSSRPRPLREPQAPSMASGQAVYQPLRYTPPPLQVPQAAQRPNSNPNSMLFWSEHLQKWYYSQSENGRLVYILENGTRVPAPGGLPPPRPS